MRNHIQIGSSSIRQSSIQSQKHRAHPLLEMFWGAGYPEGHFIEAVSCKGWGGGGGGGVKIVRGLNFSARGICQNTLFTSSLLKTLAQDSCVHSPLVGGAPHKDILIERLQFDANANSSFLFQHYHHSCAPRCRLVNFGDYPCGLRFSWTSGHRGSSYIVLVLGRRESVVWLLP